MRIIFLDTVGLIALWDKHDQWHKEADQAYEWLKMTPFVALTSSYVLLECANAAARRGYRELLVKLRTDLLAKSMLIEPKPEDVEYAWASYHLHREGTASVVDLISFSIMRRLGSTEAFTNDRHFKAAGFTTLF